MEKKQPSKSHKQLKNNHNSANKLECSSEMVQTSTNKVSIVKWENKNSTELLQILPK